MHNFCPLLRLTPSIALLVVHYSRLLMWTVAAISGKSEDVDDEIFDVVLQHLSQRPKSIIIDFENVVKQKLPNYASK